MDITVEILYSIQTHSAALPSTVDTVGNGAFPYENSGEQAIAAWIAQNYLTILFSIRYSDATKHTFGFIEEPEPCRNDTLFLSLWHTTKEDGKNRTAKSYIALNLSDYVSYLSARDSTVVAIKYRAENTNTSDINSRTYHAIYRRTNNTTN
jgi:hypothetical protein